MKIVVIGGTGLIGTKLVGILSKRGNQTMSAAPDTGVNTLTGEGLAEVLKDAQVIVDVSNSPSFADDATMNFFRTSTSNLLRYGLNAGVRHIVALSVVGAQRLASSGYLRAKVEQEKLIEAGKLPYSIVHATQFFEFVKSLAGPAAEVPEVHLAPVLFQPMAADDVAKAVAVVAVGSPINGTVEVAGPGKFRLDELVRRALMASGDARTVVADPDALYFGARLSENVLLPGADAKLSETTFDTWLAQTNSKNNT